MPYDIPAVLAHHTTSFWLRRALMTALDRDPVDALSDAEFLVILLTEKLNSVQKEHRT